MSGPGTRRALAELVSGPATRHPQPVSAIDRWTAASRELDRRQQEEEEARTRHEAAKRALTEAHAAYLRRIAEFRAEMARQNPIRKTRQETAS